MYKMYLLIDDVTHNVVTERITEFAHQFLVADMLNDALIFHFFIGFF